MLERVISVLHINYGNRLAEHKAARLFVPAKSVFVRMLQIYRILDYLLLRFGFKSLEEHDMDWPS